MTTYVFSLLKNLSFKISTISQKQSLIIHKSHKYGPLYRASGRRTRAVVITLEHAGDCPRNGFVQRADGVAVTFIPDNDREGTGGSGGREEGRRMGDLDLDAVRDQF